jgi:D-alanine-D-alanine ligase
MKKTIGVVFGGRSVEHDVSIITAHNPIIDSLLASNKYEVVPIYISKSGSWYSTGEMNDINYFRSGLEEKLSKLKPLSLDINAGLTLIESGTFGSKKTKIDIVFPAMHGTNGEDGSLMGLLRMANVPFVGCDLSASAVAMDKVLTKEVAENAGIKVVPYIWFTKHDFETDRNKVLEKIKHLKYPLFIKPVHLGSSIGISKVKSESELQNALEVALHYDEKVLVEEGVQNLIEVTLPIMGNDDPVQASIERPLNKTEFFDFSDKYLSQGKKVGGVNQNYSEIPAKIDDELSKKVIESGLATYNVLGCTGIARVDFLIDSETRDVFVNEVNTLPGSLYQHNWKQSGVSNIELVERLVSLALERFEALSKETFVFNSSILESYKGSKNQ